MAKKNRGDNREVVKYMDAISKNEKSNAHRKLKARALCTHTKAPFDPAVSYRKDEKTGKVTWVCRYCGEVIDLHRIEEKDLNAAIETVAQACNLIKLFAGTSENDQKLIGEYVADVQFKTRAIIPTAYKSALNSSGKQNRHNPNRRRHNVEWE